MHLLVEILNLDKTISKCTNTPPAKFTGLAMRDKHDIDSCMKMN